MTVTDVGPEDDVMTKASPSQSLHSMGNESPVRQISDTPAPLSRTLA